MFSAATLARGTSGRHAKPFPFLLAGVEKRPGNLKVSRASDRIRTDDPLLTMEVLCQLSYRGI
jgi:hypothetical protein